MPTRHISDTFRYHQKRRLSAYSLLFSFIGYPADLRIQKLNFAINNCIWDHCIWDAANSDAKKIKTGF